MGVFREILIIVGQDADHELVFLLCLGLEHVLSVVAVEEELAGFRV